MQLKLKYLKQCIIHFPYTKYYQNFFLNEGDASEISESKFNREEFVGKLDFMIEL